MYDPQRAARSLYRLAASLERSGLHEQAAVAEAKADYHLKLKRISA